MASRKARLMYWLSSAALVVLTALPVWAQDDTDPDPNSPTPVLLTVENSTSALALPSGKLARTNLAKIQASAFRADSKVTLFVTNLALMKDEGANAFRVYAEDAKGHAYRFPVLDLQPVAATPWIYALTVKLTDEIGYWEPPTRNGDLVMYVTWRGLTSNRVKFGYGALGGNFKDAAGTTSAPLSKYSAPPVAKTDEVGSPSYAGYRWSGDRARFLEQAAFGLSPMDDNQVRRIGLRSWLAYQFDQPYPSVSNPYPNLPLKSTNQDDVTAGCGMFTNPSPEYSACIRDHYTMYPIQKWFFTEALYGTPQLRHRVTWALAQIWVISGVDTQQSSWMITYHQQLSKNAFGNWRQLMYDLTLNPGMGNYLDMIRSTRTSPNENYPREVLQLFNIGLFMLNQDGTLQLDGQGNPIPTYDQNVVNNFTKVFTGWRDCRAAGPTAACPNITLGAPDYKDPMELVPGNHDLTAKTLLSYPGSTTTNIAACSGCSGTAITTYAYNSLNQALDNIYNHPNVAPFVSKLLIQHLVTSDPTPAYVGRVSAVFNANRSNPSQMKEVIKAILLDPEARGDVKTDPRYGKLREPVQLLTNVLREFEVGGASAAGLPPAGQSDGVVNNSVATLSQNAFNSPTVFNYYQPNYVVPGTTILGPEFGIYTTGTSIGRANLFATYAFNGLGIALPDRPNGTKINLTEAASLSAADSTGNQLLDYLNWRMLHGTMSTEMRNAILPAITAISAANSLQRAQTAVYLIATSSQFQVQR
jgi:uncharacterized protein (DUF1800 family)